MCGPMEVPEEYTSQALAVEILSQFIDKQSAAFLELEEAQKPDGSSGVIRRLDWEEVKKGFREILAVLNETHEH